MTDVKETAPTVHTAKAVGRGGIAVLGAKVFFIVIGFLQQTLLPRLIGLAGYGALSRVLAIANIVNNVIVTSSTQGVSRAVSGARGKEPEALRAALRMHVPLALGIAAVFALAAPAIARFDGAPHITTPLRAAALIVAIYGTYAPLVGSLNGRGLFTRQAALDTVFATLRTAGLLGVGWWFESHWGKGTLGATLGFVAAAALILPLAMKWAGLGRAAPTNEAPLPTVPTASKYLPAIAQLALAQLFTNVLMQSDITLLGRFLSFSAIGSGLHGAAAVKSADEWVAVYRACQLFAFLPYQLVLSITQILFPMVARAHAENDRASVRLYVGRGARLAAIACGLFVAVVAALPGSVLGFAYGGIVAQRGESTLRVLALGQGAFTMFGVAITILASLGKERISAMLGFIAVVCVVVACWSTARLAPYGELQLRAAAIATSGSLFLALAAAAVAVRTFAGSFVPLATAARVLAGVAVAVLAGMSQPRFGKLMTPLAAIAIAGVYLFVLLVTRELSGDDARLVLSLVGRKGKVKTTPPPPR